jgi:hypothetical protein
MVVRIPDSTDAVSGLVDLCLEVPIAKFVQQVDTREACSNGDGIQVIDWLLNEPMLMDMERCYEKLK